jgi:hypothetical protein
MGWEPVLYRGKWFELNNQTISWLQKFMELYLSSFNHPEWFTEILNDLHGNFHVAHGKCFFDEAIIGNDKERLNYCIKMIDVTIQKMESISKKDFFSFIKESIKDTWCDITSEHYNEVWLNDSRDYKEKYIGSLIKLKALMKED